MQLRLDDLNKIKEVKEIVTPNYDIRELKENTLKSPKWLHFGAGNIFRAYMGKVAQTLIEKGLENTGIIVSENFDLEIIEKAYTPFDNLTILTTLDKDGNFKNELIGSIVESIKATKENMEQLEEMVNNKSLQIISFTITEKGYNLKDSNGEYLKIVLEDFKNNFNNPTHLMSLITKLLYQRFKTVGSPLTLLSMDNCSKNGDKIKEAIIDIAENWVINGYVEKEFLNYLNDDEKISCPITMIDKITPRPSEKVKDLLENLGLENMDLIKTNKNSFVAPFVNSEIPGYFIVEDRFVNGRPKFEEAGIYLTDRETVERTEKMKVTTCLNPLHTALAIFGCLLSKKSIYDAISDEELNKLIKNIGYGEALKVVENPGIIDSKEFIDEVINERFLNPYIPDQPERIVTDTSQKVGIRFGETIKSYIESKDLDVKDLKFIPLVLAGWMRYLLGINDNLENISVSSDPLLEMLTEELRGIKISEEETYKGQLKNILRNEKIFGVDLERIGLSNKIEEYFIEMLAGKEAVRKTLKKYLD